MQFYLCDTPDGEQLAGTQADAKALDKGFKDHTVPTDKPGLMGYVNTLLKRAAGLDAEPANIETPIVRLLPRDPKVPNGCPACDRTPMGAKKVAQSATATEIEDRIFELDQDYLLRNIIAAAQDRLNDLQTKVA
jgi:hypothetical protein